MEPRAPASDTRDRLIALEVKLSHVLEKLVAMQSINEEMKDDVERLNKRFAELRGAKWLLFTLAVAFAGAVGIVSQVFTWGHK